LIRVDWCPPARDLSEFVVGILRVLSLLAAKEGADYAKKHTGLGRADLMTLHMG
jgi:hypothetical protein